ncbi:hypothetical protein CBL_13314 [Carabus blaptoides fortunei]
MNHMSVRALSPTKVRGEFTLSRCDKSFCSQDADPDSPKHSDTFVVIITRCRNNCTHRSAQTWTLRETVDRRLKQAMSDQLDRLVQRSAAIWDASGETESAYHRTGVRDEDVK